MEIDATKLPEPLRHKLLDAGIGDLGDLANAPRAQVEHLAKGLGADAVTKLRAALKDADDASARVRDPRTVEAWLDALFDPRQRHPNQRTNYQQIAWRWLRLDPTVPIAPGDSPALAAALKCTRQNVSAAKVRARDERWAAHPELPRLVGAVTAALDALGGAARIDTLAAALAPTLLHDAGMERDPLAGRRLEALAMIVAETAPEVAAERVHAARWIVRDRTILPTLRALGAMAGLPRRAEPAAPVEGGRRGPRGVCARHRPCDDPRGPPVALAAEGSDTAAVQRARLELLPPRDGRVPRARALAVRAGPGPRWGHRGGPPRERPRALPRGVPSSPPARPSTQVVRDVLHLAWDATRARWVRPASDEAAPSSVRSQAPSGCSRPSARARARVDARPTRSTRGSSTTRC